MKLNILVFLVSIFAYSSCKTTNLLTESPNTMQSQILDVLVYDSTFARSHTGLFVKELGSEKVVFDHKSDQYFTPASNTKLLTFYTCLNVLEDHINGLKFFENEDSLIIWGTGDASFLNPYLYENDFISEKLRSTSKTIYFSTSNFQDNHYGSGWSWDDYNYRYQTDKHSLPIYGNLVNFRKSHIDSELEVRPKFFRKLIKPKLESQASSIVRDQRSNLFFYDYNKLKGIRKVNRYVPYLTSDQFQQELLADYLGREVNLIHSQVHIGEAKSIKSVHVDSLYTLLLQPSDNFVAEQLLLNCSSELFDILNTRKIITWSQQNLLKDLPHDFQWVDGSGLSRYNMTTPGNMVHLLEKIHKKIDQKRLFRLLPTGGESGTIKYLYKSDQPFVHAKTGSLRNNHSLSGFIIGDSGKVYVFSFMNSNYLVSNQELKKGMGKILSILKENL